MAKRKSSQQSDMQDPAQVTSKSKASEASSSTLVIYRNKQIGTCSSFASPMAQKRPLLTECSLLRHWRYILLPWAKAPTPEVLETLENGTYTTPRLYPIDPSVLFDLVKIREAADEATNLAVCAASGVASAPLSSSLNASNGMINSAGAAALGLGFGGNSGGAKLSRSRVVVNKSITLQSILIILSIIK